LGRGSAILSKSCGLGLEGIVSKLADAPCRIGRDRSWLKSKCSQRQEFVFLAIAMPQKRRALGAAYLGYRKNGSLRYAGKVGRASR
jgi:bifunctional non-homologous end joining protein LigD